MSGRVERVTSIAWVHGLSTRLRSVDAVNAITLFAAALLLSVLPFLILLSSLANERIDDDLSDHIGLNSRGAHIVSDLFRHSPSHAAAPIALGLIVGLAGTLAMVSYLQVIYERIFGLEHRGWRDLHRFVAWGFVLSGALVAEALLSGPVRTTAGPVIRGLLSVLGATLFFALTMRLLLAGRVSWGLLIRPAVLSALLWLALTLFSSAYFSSSIVTERKLYGTLGVVFTLMTWFIALGGVIVFGAVGGVVWQEHSARAATGRRTRT